MKRMHLRWSWQAPCLALCLLLNLAERSPAQVGTTNYLLPVVSIQATDPIANLSGDTGTFTVFRDGPTNASLYVYYCIGGTASNGVDYAQIGNLVSIPAGVTSNNITIKPINHGQTNPIETVVLYFCPSPLMIPINYVIGYPTSAVVYIEGPGVTNIPPAVKIAIPTNGAVFYTPVNIPIAAEAFDPDGYVATVEFFADTTSLGIRTNNPLSASPVNPFYLIWSNVPPGNYALTALATDNGGATATSAPVKISVLQGPPPPPTNLPPVVRIVSPPNGAMFRAPVDVPIYAYAQDFDGFVASVEFFADATNSLGFGKPLPPPVAVGIGPTPTGWVYPTNVYFLVWSNAPLGAHVLTAKATDDGAAFTVSAPVNISILPPPPPPTNQPPIVSIIAIDPVAIEGTNCWPWLGLTNTWPTWSNWLAGTTFCRFFTNCGPKNATFAVRRFGLTNDALTVTYAIGGTATNGVDYVALPGSVSIPAGERLALISVVPIDDGPPDISSTVILKLIPSTNYIIGLPPAAAAIIIDSTWPPLATGMLPDNCFHLSTTGPNGAWVRIDYSTDLVTWTNLCINQVINGSVDFIDPDAQTSPSRFYRAVPETSAPLY